MIEYRNIPYVPKEKRAEARANTPNELVPQMKTMLDDGRSIADIAERFELTEASVRGAFQRKGISVKRTKDSET